MKKSSILFFVIQTLIVYVLLVILTAPVKPVDVQYDKYLGYVKDVQYDKERNVYIITLQNDATMPYTNIDARIGDEVWVKNVGLFNEIILKPNKNEKH